MRVAFLFAALSFGLAGPPLTAQPLAEEAGPADLADAAEGVAAVLSGNAPAATVFSPEFLKAVPAERLEAIVGSLVAQVGTIEGFESFTATGPASGIVTLRFGRATVAGPISLGPDGKVAGLLLNDIRPLGDSTDAIAAELRALPGQVSVLYAPLDRSRRPLVSVGPEEQLAVGSTFKLYVLSALAHEVARGVRQWDDVVTLDARSFASGTMQDWPKGSPVTLHTLAAAMISQSDNTATDQLIHTLGRAAIHEEVRVAGHARPERMLPFLTTLELFALKADPARAAMFAKAGEDRQGTLLEALAQEVSRAPAAVPPPRYIAPTMIDTIEWFASAQDLRRLVTRIDPLGDPTAREIMAIAPALPEPKRGEWSYIGYKGGSEPGVLNLTWLLHDRAGTPHILTMSWNDPAAPVDVQKFELLAQRLLSLPK